MKKIIIIISIINFACTDYIFAQSKNIQNAYNSYIRTDRDGVRLKMKEAKDFIDLTSINCISLSVRATCIQLISSADNVVKLEKNIKKEISTLLVILKNIIIFANIPELEENIEK